MLLDHAAKGMSAYDEHEWWVAKQVLKHDVDKLIMHVDLSTFSQCGTNFQSIFLSAAQVPDSLATEERMAIVVCPDPYVDVDSSLAISLSKTSQQLRNGSHSASG